MALDGFSIIETARRRLALEVGADPDSGDVSREEYLQWFAWSLGRQLRLFAYLGLLHDYRALRGPGRDARLWLNTLGDTNVTLAAEFPDLETAIWLDDPDESAIELFRLTRSESRNLKMRFHELHKVEVELAQGIAMTVGALGLPDTPDADVFCARAFQDGYGNG
jgi:hypothetical protein